VVWEVKEVDDQVVFKEVERLVEHKTVVTDLWVDEEGVWSCSFTFDLSDASSSFLEAETVVFFPSTASADTSAHYHSLNSPKSPPTPSPLPNPLTTYATPAIHALLPLPHLTPPLLLTGSGDEHIRIWDLSQGESSARMIREVEGHCAEVMGLRRWVREEDGKKEEWVVSSGLDGTIRRWKLAGEYLSLPSVLQYDTLPKNLTMGPSNRSLDSSSETGEEGGRRRNGRIVGGWDD